jgi:hypothetical protein
MQKMKKYEIEQPRRPGMQANKYLYSLLNQQGYVQKLAPCRELLFSCVQLGGQ